MEFSAERMKIAKEIHSFMAPDVPWESTPASHHIRLRKIAGSLLAKYQIIERDVQDAE